MDHAYKEDYNDALSHIFSEPILVIELTSECVRACDDSDTTQVFNKLVQERIGFNHYEDSSFKFREFHGVL